MGPGFIYCYCFSLFLSDNTNETKRKRSKPISEINRKSKLRKKMFAAARDDAKYRSRLVSLSF